MRVDDKLCGQEVLSRLIAKPADDGHPAIFPIMVYEHLTAEVVVKVDLVPGVLQAGQAFLCCFDPGGPGVPSQEIRGPFEVVIEEQDSSRAGGRREHRVNLAIFGG